MKQLEIMMSNLAYQKDKARQERDHAESQLAALKAENARLRDFLIEIEAVAHKVSNIKHRSALIELVDEALKGGKA